MARKLRSKHWPISVAALGAGISAAAIATGQWLPMLGKFIWGPHI